MERVDRVIELARQIAAKTAKLDGLRAEIADLRVELESYVTPAAEPKARAPGRPSLTGKTLPVRALEIMRKEPGRSMAPVEFARALGVKPKTMRTVLSRLMKGGHVERVETGKYRPAA